MTLIERFGLEKDVSANAGAGADAKAAWLDTAQKREASLKERKAAMILAARQCVFFIFWSYSLFFVSALCAFSLALSFVLFDT